MASLHLTWPGFEAAVDLIAAQCQRQGRTGIYGPLGPGLMLAIALADRLELQLLEHPAPGMLLVLGCHTGTELQAVAALEDVEAWAWVCTAPGHGCNSVMRVDGPTRVLWPWQDALGPHRRPFVEGFDD